MTPATRRACRHIACKGSYVRTLVSTELELDSPSASSSDALRVGTFAGPWKIQHELGRGGMGTVYAVEHARIGKRAALKVLHRRIPQPERNAERMLLEARVVNAIGHPNIVDVFDVGATDDGRPYIVMERLDGRPLSESTLDRSEAIAVLRQVCAALEAAHASGVIHRDLKPDNIFIGASNGHVTLLDWGIARVVGEDMRTTLEGQLVGTPQYIAPEQALGSALTPKTDVYSLGLVAYELLVGEPPFTAGTVAEMLARHVYTPPHLPEDLDPPLPPHLASLVLQMLAKDPAARPTIAEVARRLVGPVAGSLERRLPPALVVDDPPPPARRRWPLAVGIAAIAIASTATLAWLATRGTSASSKREPSPLRSTPSVVARTPAPRAVLPDPMLEGCADPSVLRDGGRFYMTCTASSEGRLFPIYESTELAAWHRVGWIFPSEASRPTWADGNYWAPELHRDGDHIAAYFSMRVTGGSNAIGIATASTVTGPYIDSGAPLIEPPHGASDAHLFLADGRRYVYYKREGNPSEIWAFVDGEQAQVLTVSEPWEHGNIEAPWVVHEGRYYYLFYSGSQYCDVSYAIGVARATSPLGPFEKRPEPLIRTDREDASWLAPGHSTVFDGPAGEHLIAYHAYRASEGSPSCDGRGGNRHRHVRVQPLTYVDGWPVVAAP